MNRRIVAALSTAGLVAAGAVCYALSGGPDAASPAARPSAPGQVNTVALRDLSTGSGGQVMGLPAGRTKPFSLLGVSWDAARTRLDGAVRVRTHSAATGGWSAWRAVEAQSDDAPDGRGSDRQARGATAPLWVGPSDGVEVRVAGNGRALPQGLRVELVDPGDGRHRPGPRAAGEAGDGMTLAAAVSAETAGPDPSSSPGTPVQPSSPASVEPSAPEPSTAPSVAPAPSSPVQAPDASAPPAPAPAAPSSTAPQPAIVSRAQWGADETLVKEPVEYAPAAKVVFVHHTADSNDYTCAQSPSIIRSIMLYHVKTQGWNDIGYNFLVDKCGTIFEGRAGGVDKPVIGAQTYGFNTNSSGVAVLGTYTSVAPSQAALSAVAKIAAWKLGLTGADPNGKSVLSTPFDNGKFKAGSYTFNNISGHRDGYATECPGTLLYGKLSAIRTEAKQWTTPATAPVVSGISGATKVDTRYYTKGTVTLSWHPAAVSSYEVRVDGEHGATADGQATSAKITLAAGAHNVQLHAHNINATLAVSPTYSMVSDTTAPVFATPAGLTVRTGTVSAAGSIPVRLGWKATDNTLLQSVKATSPSTATFTPTTTSWSTYSKANTSYVWSLTAADAAGNTGTSSATRTAALVNETSAARTGTWKTTTTSSYLGGKGLYSTAKGASASYTFTGRSVGLIAKRATNFGAFYVYVDGVKVATVDLKASASAYRQIVWTQSWSTSAKHTVKIVVAGTSGRPTVATDGMAYVK